VSIRIQNDSVALVADAGIATDWASFSVTARPLPPSHSFQVPVRAGRPESLVIGPEVPVQFTAPDSKPGFSSRLSPVGGFGERAPEQAAAPAGPMLYAVAQILVRVPEGSSPDQVAALRKKAEDLLARAKRGDDFASLAAANSDGPEALQGGVMGVRPLDGWPDLFAKALGNLQKGQVSGLLKSGNGFHILKVMDRGTAAPPPSRTARAPAPAPAPQPRPQPQAQAPQGPVEVMQTHARHILIKTSTVMSDEQARQRLEQVRQRLVAGDAKFSDMARQYSQDATAPQGGDLGWLNPGETVPTFEAAMNALKPGEISQPIQTPFGWHLIQVEERRQHDATDDLARMRARQTLFERRAQPAFEDWLDQLRAQAYIDNRLEKQDRINQNNR